MFLRMIFIIALFLPPSLGAAQDCNPRVSTCIRPMSSPPIQGGISEGNRTSGTARDRLCAVQHRACETVTELIKQVPERELNRYQVGFAVGVCQEAQRYCGSQPGTTVDPEPWFPEPFRTFSPAVHLVPATPASAELRSIRANLLFLADLDQRLATTRAEPRASHPDAIYPSGFPDFLVGGGVLRSLKLLGKGGRILTLTRRNFLNSLVATNLYVAPTSKMVQHHFPQAVPHARQLVQHLRHAEAIRRSPLRIERVTRAIK